MIFQPISPLRSFQQRIKKRSNWHSQSNASLEPLKVSPKSTKPRPMSKTLSQADTVIPSESILSVSTEDYPIPSWSASLAGQLEGTITNDAALSDQLKARRQSAGTTNSSPTDPSYLPIHQVLVSHPTVTGDENCSISQQPTIVEEHSFFESDSEYSDDESPVIGRASSVRTSTPLVVQHHSTTLERAGTMYGRHLHPNVLLVSDSVSESTPDQMDTTEDDFTSDVYEDTVQALDKDVMLHPLPRLPQSTYTAPSQTTFSPTTTKVMLGGLRSNPVTEADMVGVHRANTSPLPKENNRKVRIRPSDLVVTHMKENPRFHEPVVSTPYPAGMKSKHSSPQQEKKHTPIKNPFTAHSPNTAVSLRTHRTPRNNDRFPSPHHPEVLFLDLNLANHPTMTISLEIEITDKDRFDDEMLFRQLRSAYCTRLLGWSRLPFRLVRSISHVTTTIPSSIDTITFNTSDFTRHLSKPRLGRKRKTWTIWLRNHNLSQAHSPNPISPRQDTDHFTVQKRPIHIPRPSPAEKRLSMDSDSTTSIFDLSILPPLSISRIPFFRDRLSQQSRNQSQAQADTQISEKHESRETDIEKHPITSKPLVTINTTTSLSTSPFVERHPHIQLQIHHKFNIPLLTLLFFFTILSSISSTVLWIIFGLPGSRPGHDAQPEKAITYSGLASTTNNIAGSVIRDWEYNAQERVLTGLVMGLVVLILGVVGEVGVLFGGWVLL